MFELASLRCFVSTRVTITTLIFLIASVSLLIAGCGGGSSGGNQGPAPSNLSYPQTTINATVGAAIATDTPTVTGTVTGYTISPSLPAGLSLNSTTGVLSGTPTAALAKATYTVTASNPAGSATTTIQISVSVPVTPPTNLTYPQTTINATVGVAITTDTPTVTGTVTGYTISPSLPAGLSLDAASGAISGTPTAALAKANYTVTATNSAGSTTTTIQITVSLPVVPPSHLTYPQSALTLEVNQPFPSDIPSFSGLATFTVSPALPAGLMLDPVTGSIYGLPTASAGSATYTVTAANSGGSTTATITLLVNPALTALLDLGSAYSIDSILTTTTDNNVLTQDNSGHWVLLSYSTGKEIASGQGSAANDPTQAPALPIKTAGTIFVVGVNNGLEVRSTSDGHLISILSFPTTGLGTINWWTVASDGSYITAGSTLGLVLWSPSGTALLEKSGDYGPAQVFAAPGQILVASGAAGQNVIETIATASGNSTIGAAFSGTFNTWFTDGKYFITNSANNVWVYDTTSKQQSFITLPSTGVNSIGGHGNWIWTTVTVSGSTPSYSVNVYALGSSTPAASYPVGVDETIIPSGSTIGLLDYGVGNVEVVDLSGSSPVETKYTAPTLSNSAFGAISATEWLVGNSAGAILDGATLSTTPRFLSQGTAFDIAASTSTVAVATAAGNVYLYNPADTTLQETIPFQSSQLALSSDGSELAASNDSAYAQYHNDETLNLYALPGATVTRSWPYQFDATGLFAFSLSPDGSAIGQSTGTFTNSAWQYKRFVASTKDGSVLWSDTPTSGNGLSGIGNSPDAPLLSPNGDNIAASNGPAATSAVVIYQNAKQTAALSGVAVGWIDENDLLVDLYTYNSKTEQTTYQGSTIYTPTGTAVSSPGLPQILSFQPLTSSSIYVPATNTIYSTSTGSSTWTSTYPNGGKGAVVNNQVIFLSGARVVVQSQNQ